MSTYISNNKFQFITDFGKHAYLDVKGNAYELNFNDLSIAERIMLSSYLTFLCCNKDNKLRKNDLYNLIFDFNGKNKKKTSYQDAFIEDLSNFIARQPYYFAYVKSHYDEIVNDKTFIYRQQLNHSEMELLYSLKFQRNYHSLMNVLYIIGVAKQNITSAYLNKIPLSNIYSHSTLAKKRVEEIFSKINSVSAKEVKFKISKGILYFGNGFFIEEDEKYQSTEKQQFNKLQAEEEIISSLVTSPDEVCNEIVDEIQKHTEEKEIQKPKVVCDPPIEPIVEETEEETIPEEETVEDIPEVKKETLGDIVTLGEGNFNFNIFKKIAEYNYNNPQKIDDVFIKACESKICDEKKYPHKSSGPAFLSFLTKRNLNVNTLVKSKENLFKYIDSNGKIKDEKWREIKDNARIEYKDVKEKICKGLSDLYDENKNYYLYVVLYLFKAHQKFLTLNIN